MSVKFYNSKGEIKMTELKLVESKELREQVSARVEVLDKVKQLFLIPEMEMMTIKQVAEYYEVDLDTIKKTYKRNKTEIDSDGTGVKTLHDFLRGHDVPLETAGDFLKSQAVTLEANAGSLMGHDVTLKAGEDFLKFHNETLKTVKGKSIIKLSDDITLEIPNRGIRCFSKRAILRIGMLLRDSVVAKEVRTQLLNTLEESTVEQKTKQIDKETDILTELAMGIAKSYMDSDIDALLLASQKYSAYQNRHIEKLKEENYNLGTSYKMLTKDILMWDNPEKLNKAVRVIAGIRDIPFGFVWKELYDELLYKHHIGVKMRGKAPYVRYIRNNEWGVVQQSLSAICEKNGIAIDSVLKQTLSEECK